MYWTNGSDAGKRKSNIFHCKCLLLDSADFLKLGLNLHLYLSLFFIFISFIEKREKDFKCSDNLKSCMSLSGR